MDDSQLADRPEQMPASPIDQVLPDTSKKNRRTLFIVAGGLLAALCLCTVVCIVGGGWAAINGLLKAAQEQDEVAEVIDEFMHAMERKDAAAAHMLFSTLAQRQTTLSAVEELLEGNNYILFEGYENVVVTEFGINFSFYTNPDMPQGLVAEVEGEVNYEGDFTGRFTATLEEERGEWMLLYINIVAPPEKFNSP